MTEVTNLNDSQIRKVIDMWVKSVQEKNIAGILANHTTDILLYDVIPPFQNIGLEGYKKAWEKFFNFSSGGDNSFYLTELIINSGDTVAFATATLKVFDLNIRLTLGLVNLNGNWLIAHEHHSSLD